MALVDIYEQRALYERWLRARPRVEDMPYATQQPTVPPLPESSWKARAPAKWALYDRSIALASPRARSRDPWTLLRDAATSIEVRATALFTLCESTDPRVCAWIIDELARTHASAWRAHLIEATEILHFADATMRERLRDVLELQIQQMLADKDEGPALWAAVRRIGTLLSDGEAERLISLLEVDRLVTTKQVALQALEQLCLRSSISAEVGTVRLCDAVYAILRDLIAMDAEVRSAEQDALLINSLLVCAVLGDGRAVEEARRFASQVDKLFRGLIVKRLEAATAALRARKNDGAPTSRRLTNVEAILAVLPS